MRRTWMLSLASLALLSCSSAPPADQPLDPQMQLEKSWEPGKPVMVMLRAKDRSVAVSISSVLVNSRGVLCRVVSVSDVFDPDKPHTGLTIGVQECDIRRADKVGSSGYGYSTAVHPRADLTWEDVKGKDDLVLETEAG